MSKDSTAKSASGLLYLDNGATSFPKPPQVAEAITRWLREVGGSPGRSGHRLSTEAARELFETRESVARLLGASSSKQIVFAKNATEAINTAILGILERGDRVVTTSMEHNSVMRPLRHLQEEGRLDLEVVACGKDGSLDLGRVREALRPGARLMVSTHASNVTGTIMPIGPLASLCREMGTLLLVDAAQTAGAVPLEVEADGIDLLAFTGHKSLFGPMGTGGLYIREGVRVRPLLRGGTGSRSEHEEQPDFLPDSLESGTPNAVGLAGLRAGVEFLLATGVERVRREEKALTARLLEGLRAVPGLKVWGPGDAERTVAVVSFTLEALSPSEVGYILDEAFGIMTRVGLHCAPSAHRTIGTFPSGTVRLCPGFFLGPEDIDYVLESLLTVARKKAAR